MQPATAVTCCRTACAPEDFHPRNRGPSPSRMTELPSCQMPILAVSTVDLPHRMPAVRTWWPTTGDFHPDPDCGELTRAPDSPPTGKTSETVKERVWFYASYKNCQRFPAHEYLPCFQSSAARPQGGATKTVQVDLKRSDHESRMDRLFAAFRHIPTRINGRSHEYRNVQIRGKTSRIAGFGGSPISQIAALGTNDAGK